MALLTLVSNPEQFQMFGLQGGGGSDFCAPGGSPLPPLFPTYDFDDVSGVVNRMNAIMLKMMWQHFLCT